ncbi:hypothetical protein ACFYOC_25515 [Nocardiopsis alba]|uniref:hypothetical protein n=1 Tax=Nocardiopsis alba TaxID=53437 RepID=UPI003690395F
MIPAHAVVGYLQTHGYPNADAAMTGITGTGRTYWSVTSRSAEHAGDDLLADWIEDTRRAAVRRQAALGVLVTPRADYGTGRVASWWAHLDMGTLARTVRGRLALPVEVSSGTARMSLSMAALLTRAAGHGTPLRTEVEA